MPSGPESSADDDDGTLYRVLFVCTSSTGGSWSSRTGLWLDELATPYYVFKEVGYEMDIATISGGPAPIDQACFLPQNQSEHSTMFLNDAEAQAKFSNASALKDLVDHGSLNVYGCIFLCGGHGAVEDFPYNMDIKRAVEIVYNDNLGCVAAICHGPLGLLTSRQSNGRSILQGRFVAAFSNEEEDSLGLSGVLSILTETAMDDIGATCIPSSPWRPKAVVDGRVVTGQNPQSSLQVAQRVLDVVRSLGDKYSPPGNINKPWGQ